MSRRLHEEYGDIVKVEGLLNRPDMVFLYDADEIERIFRQEERMPHRPKMPSLDYYKHNLRKDIFSDNPGVIAVSVQLPYFALPFLMDFFVFVKFIQFDIMTQFTILISM